MIYNALGKTEVYNGQSTGDWFDVASSSNFRMLPIIYTLRAVGQTPEPY